MRITFATGADTRLFWNVCALAWTFSEHNPGHHLRIADFGLNPAQAQFLSSIRLLSAAPKSFDPIPHPWICKTALNQFEGLSANECDALAWVDADMLAVGPMVEDAIAIGLFMKEHGAAAAACRDNSGLSLNDFIHVYRDAGMPVEPFHELLVQRGVKGTEPYLNTGFLMIVDHSFWPAWHGLTSTIAPHVAFDQSTFNALVHSSSHHCLELDGRSWNVHNGLIALHEPGVQADGEPVRLLHPTSMASEHHLWQPVQLSIHGHSTTIDLKTFKRADLHDQHVRALNAFMSHHGESLLRSGLLNRH
jgi:hypothetical protein